MKYLHNWEQSLNESSNMKNIKKTAKMHLGDLDDILETELKKVLTAEQWDNDDLVLIVKYTITVEITDENEYLENVVVDDIKLKSKSLGLKPKALDKLARKLDDLLNIEDSLDN